MATILMPLPERDFEPTEAAAPWRQLRDRGHEVIVATEHGGRRPVADPVQLGGVFWGRFGADPTARSWYQEMEETPELRSPIPWSWVEPADIDALLLPGGRAPGMRPYLESPELQQLAAALLAVGKPVGAICHGILVLARAREPTTGKSPLSTRRTTCLPKHLERLAYLATAWRYGRRFRTYPAYVEDEVQSALADPHRQLLLGPVTIWQRGTVEDDRAAFCVVDGS